MATAGVGAFFAWAFQGVGPSPEAKESVKLAAPVKVAGLNAQAVIDRIEAIRSAVGPRATLRIDANRSWSYGQALEILLQTKGSSLEFVEEPLMAPTPAALRKLRSATGVAFACDESVRTREELDRLIEAESCDVVILKPMFIGGLLPSLALAPHGTVTVLLLLT